ncbi:MAG TPA: BatA and WFA domain-containing protein [Bryobacteraceae bacterium]|nr:BatA and WFA domain-containing protein [Bryobacteraceae bacterium]
MFFFNLSPLEFFALFGAVSSFVVALYLLSRSRRKQTVSTLRFWQQAQRPVTNKQRRRIQQPVSLLLQIIGCCLLLLALAQLRLGSPVTSSREHIVILDTSSWMAANARGGTLMDEAKSRARAYVNALPGTDKVMIIRADAVPTPVTGMEARRETILAAINESRPAAAALNLDQSLTFANQLLQLRAENPGEIVYIGTNKTAEGGAPGSLPKRLRFIPVSASVQNVGLTKVGLRRSPKDGELWECFLSIRNYTTAPKRVPAVLRFGGAPVASRLVVAEAMQTAEVVLPFRTKAAGWLEVQLVMKDALEEDNRAIIELPSLQPLNVTVFSDDPSLLRPALTALPYVNATFRTTSEFKEGSAGMVILDGFNPPATPSGASLWIDPPAERSPIAVRSNVQRTTVTRWNASHDIAFGLNTRRFELPSAKVYALGKEDVAIAESDSGPVIVVRESKKMVVLGFDPGTPELRNELATALILANSLRWMNPSAFQVSEIFTAPVGSVNVPVSSGLDSAAVRVTGERRNLPFSVNDGTLRFFSADPDMVRVRTSDGDRIYSLSLPEIATAEWEAPANIPGGIPRSNSAIFSRDLWHWLAVAGVLVLLAEWLIYGSGQKIVSKIARPGFARELRKAS